MDITMFSWVFWTVIGILCIWDGVWKLVGMWKSASKKRLAWFICIGIFNTVGILPIVYLIFFHNKRSRRKKK